MDILIKGMEMPKCCYETDGQVVKPCDFLEVCRRKWGVNINALDIHSEACPLVALPEHHGRIVDLDKVLDWLINEKRVFSMAMSAKVVKALSEAPVIVEATE